MGKNALDKTANDKRNLRPTKGQIMLLIVGAVLVTIVIGVIILAPVISAGNKVIKEDTFQPDVYLTEWMSFISDDAPICKIAIPGSHDSGCYDMPYYAATQDLTIGEQLARGVRYFDIRVNNSSDEYVIYHGPVKGVSYDSVLADISAFVNAHPSEFLILDFSHFKNDSEAEVFARFERAVGTERLIVNDSSDPVGYVDSLALGDVRGKILVLIDRDETDFDGKDYLFERTGDKDEYPDAVLTSLYKKYYNAKSAKYFVEKVVPMYFEQFAEIDEGIFVLQAQLTDMAFVFGPRYREGVLIDMMNDYVRSLADSKYIGYANVIMRDFVTCEKCALTINLNFAKGYVNPDTAEEFAAGIAEYI